MIDYGQVETDYAISCMRSRVEEVYSETAIELEKKLNDYMARYKAKDSIKREMLKRGEITLQEYNYWKTGQIMIGKRWEEMKDTISRDLHNANNIARSIVRGYMPEVYALNHNYATFQVEKESLVDTSYTLYDRQTVERIIRSNPDLLPPPGPRKKAEIAAGKDIKWQSRQLQSAMTKSILMGDSIPHTAKRLSNELSVKNRDAAIRYARTAATGAQNAGRVDAYKRAEGMGIELEQEWLATLDSRTRHEHRMLDGQHVKVGESFIVGGDSIRFPGDPWAPGYLVWNCRCTLVPRLKNLDQSDAPRNSKLGDMDYDEWKNEHTKVNTQEQLLSTAPYSQWESLQKKQSLDHIFDIGKRQISEMTQEQRDALEFYTNGNSDPMNLYFRDRTAFNRLGYPEEYMQEVVKHAENARTALLNAQLPETILSTRGGGIHIIEELTGSSLENDEIDTYSLIGKVFRDKGMLSTAVNDNETDGYTTLCKIHTRFNKGSHAVYVDPISTIGFETELLGAPNIGFRILHAEYDDNEVLHVFIDSM